ncbi:hypothetical protein ACH5RR_000044 [Cinchona calisaya]|uniref:Protein yippee-like n=1 Tax=Cinchona calisaya TaxID=153742 RepID=A0ABD3AZM9_9GENT
MNKNGDSLIQSRLYCCFKCRNVIAIQDDIVAKDFVAGKFRAFLFSHVANVMNGPAVDRTMITGRHKVSDVWCSDCLEKLGWKYEKVYAEAHSYKLGKTVLIRSKIDSAY